MIQSLIIMMMIGGGILLAGCNDSRKADPAVPGAATPAATAANTNADAEKANAALPADINPDMFNMPKVDSAMLQSLMPEVVVTMDGKTLFTREQIINRIAEIAGTNFQFLMQVVPKLNTAQTLKQEIVMPMIDQEIVVELAKKAGFTPSKEGAAEYLNAQFKELPPDLQARYLDQLKQQGIASWEDYVTRVSTEPDAQRDIAIQRWIETVRKELPELDSAMALKEGYDAIKDSQVLASHILITPNVGDSSLQADDAMSRATAEQKAEAKAKMQSIRDEIAAGADFAEKAKTHSGCPSGQQGGSLGVFRKGQMVPVFETTAFALQPGALSEVIESPFGYHIIRRATEAEFMDAVKDDLARIARDKQLGDAVSAKIEQAKKDLKVDVKL